MFTGLIQETGTVAAVKNTDNSLYLSINCKKVLDGLKIGDSIAVNGACQTVVELTETSFKVFASFETINSTTFKNFKSGTVVNLEKTLRLCDRLDGHLVSGHVDGTAKVLDIENNGQAVEFSFEVPEELSRQIVKKGSVTIDGISLTVADITGNKFRTAVIPHTYQETNLHTMKIGHIVNLETDMIAKYIEKYLLSNDNGNNINMSLLERNGFL